MTVNPNRGREGSRLPALRTVQAVLPHTALQSVVASSRLARQRMGPVHHEEPLCSEEGILLPPLTPLSSAANIRSDHTAASTQYPLRFRASVSRLAVSSTGETPRLRATLWSSRFHLPASLPSTRVMLSRVSRVAPFDGRRSVLSRFHARRFHRAALVVSFQHLGTVKALTPARCHCNDGSPRLTRPYLPGIPSPTTSAIPDIALAVIVSVSGVFRLRHVTAGSPLHPAESGSLSYGLLVRFRLLSTPPCGDAVTFRYKGDDFL